MIQTTNIRRILDRAMRHPLMRDIPFETAIEYAVDFIQLMGTPAIYTEKTAKIPISDWRGELPCDFEKMIQVRIAADEKHKHPGPAYRYSSDSFHMSPDHAPEISRTYKIQGHCIFTSTRDIPVEIAYRAFAVDDEGLPLLPDNASFLRGLENYIKLQWFTILYDTGKISYQVLANAQQEYAWSAGDAQSEFSRLDLDKAETLSNAFNTLLPHKASHMIGYFDKGEQELWHTHNGR